MEIVSFFSGIFSFAAIVFALELAYGYRAKRTLMYPSFGLFLALLNLSAVQTLIIPGQNCIPRRYSCLSYHTSILLTYFFLAYRTWIMNNSKVVLGFQSVLIAFYIAVYIANCTMFNPANGDDYLCGPVLNETTNALVYVSMLIFEITTLLHVIFSIRVITKKIVSGSNLQRFLQEMKYTQVPFVISQSVIHIACVSTVFLHSPFDVVFTFFYLVPTSTMIYLYQHSRIVNQGGNTDQSKATSSSVLTKSGTGIHRTSSQNLI